MLVIDKNDGIGYQKISSKKKTPMFNGDDKRKTQYNNEILLTESLEVMDADELQLGCPIYYQSQLKFNQSNSGDGLKQNLICYTQLSNNMCSKQSNSNQAEKQANTICDYLRLVRELNLKICVIGKLGVGKTSLIMNYVKQKYDQQRNQEGSSQLSFYGTSNRLSRVSQEFLTTLGTNKEDKKPKHFVFSDKSSSGVNQEISDIEKMQFIYRDEHPVDIEIWDTVGQEKFNELFIYSQNYVQGKHGVILVVNALDFIGDRASNISINSSEINMFQSNPVQENIQDLLHKLTLLGQSCKAPISIFFNNTPTYYIHFE